jgi:hypothetical protein
MRNGHVFLKSGLKVKSQNQKKITIKLNCLFFLKNPLLNDVKKLRAGGFLRALGFPPPKTLTATI